MSERDPDSESGSDGDGASDLRIEQPNVTFDEAEQARAQEQGSTGAPPPGTAERIQKLRAENQRLRREYSHARRVEYDRTALGLGVVGLVAIGAAVFLPSVREVLIVVGSIGVFAAVLTRFITPERFLPVDVAEGIYDSIDETRGGLVAELDLVGDPRYVPTDQGTARLFVSQREGAPLPDSTALESTLVVPEDDDRRGVAFTPSGQTLVREFERTLSGPLGDSPRETATVLAEGVSDGLELVDTAKVKVDTAERRVSMRLSGVPFGAVDRMDHPVVSFVGIGLATGLETAVSVADARSDDDGAVVTYTYEPTSTADEDEHEDEHEDEEAESVETAADGTDRSGASDDS